MVLLTTEHLTWLGLDPGLDPHLGVGVSLALLAARVCGVEYRPAVVVAVGPGVALVVAMEAVGAVEVAWSRLGVG